MCSSPAIQDFGRIVAIGIFFAYLLTLAILPALLIRSSHSLSKSLTARPPFLQNHLQTLINLTQRRDGFIFWFCSGLAVVTLLMLPMNETNFNRLDFIAADSDIRQYYDEVTEKMNRGPALTYGIDMGIKIRQSSQVFCGNLMSSLLGSQISLISNRLRVQLRS